MKFNFKSKEISMNEFFFFFILMVIVYIIIIIFKFYKLKNDENEDDDNEEDNEDNEEDDNEDDNEEENIEGLSDEESEEELDENYVSSDEETDNTVNNSNSETFVTADGRIMTNPTIPGVLPREVYPEINPVYDSDTSDEVSIKTMNKMLINLKFLKIKEIILMN